MLVLMDMEWIENKRHFFCPTQISAMRVDNNWNDADHFNALIKPFDSSCRQWNHVAYSGAKPNVFLAADEGPRVFLNLFRWFRYDDVLCWWREQPALVFETVVGNLLHREVDHSMRVVYPAWIMDTADRHLMVGSPYQLARDRGIEVPAREHSSKNDVEAIRALLCGTYTSSASIRSSRIGSTAKIMTQVDSQKERKSKEMLAAAPSKYRLFYDPEERLLHTSGCPDISGIDSMQGFNTYKSCIQKGLKPCRCCRDDYREKNWQLSQEIIQKCQFNYIYQFKGRTFHRTSCVHAKRIPFMELRGGIYYMNCLENGLQPCRWCKPSLKQQIAPMHIYSYHSQGNTPQDNSDAVWIMTRKLTPEEKTALHRHEAARKEREALSKDTQIKTLAERHDEHTLTQSGYAFWSATGYQNFHLRNCPKLDHISGICGFARYYDAIRAGLTPCKLCKPSSKFDIIVSVPIYHEERQGESIGTLDRLCDAHGYKHHFEMPDYYIETPVGKWRLDTRTRPVDVFHINLVMSPEAKLYHKQHRLFLSLADTFEYIRRHEYSLMEKMRTKNVNETADRSSSLDPKDTGDVA